jgi:hypothetical protein
MNKLMRDRAKSRFSRRTIVQQPARLLALGDEVKALDIPVGTYTLNSTALVTPLNLIRAGSSFFNRIGRRVEMKNLHLKLQIASLRTVAVNDYVRVMVVYDRQTNGALPAITDILQDTDQAGANTTNSYSSLNLNNRDRFIMLCDWRICLPSQTLTAGQVTTPGFVDPVETLIDLERFIKLKGLITQYRADSAPAVIGDVASGGLYLVTYGNSAPGNEGFQAGGSLRLRYHDK